LIHALPIALRGCLETERAITVELQFVRPGRSFGQLGDCQGEHRLDESRPDFLTLHFSSVANKKDGAQSLCYRMAEKGAGCTASCDRFTVSPGMAGKRFGQPPQHTKPNAENWARIHRARTLPRIRTFGHGLRTDTVSEFGELDGELGFAYLTPKKSNESQAFYDKMSYVS
jgi:hypothetical protein